MTHYLVRGTPAGEPLAHLEASLAGREILTLRPFGRALHVALLTARLSEDGSAWWEEEDYCSPPLREERSVLDRYFVDLVTEAVEPGAGWQRILELPFLFPRLLRPEALHQAARESLGWLREARARNSGSVQG